jgi:P27 family predicted phage terminase small subunit
MNPPIPLHLRILRGNPGKRPLRNEPQPKIEAKVPDPPPFIAEYAKEEWARVAPQLHVLGLISVVDVMPLAAYCQSYAQWRTAVELLQRMAQTNPVTRGLLIKTAAGDPRRNPVLKIARDAAADMLKFAGEFGLTPVARARLGAAGWDQPTGPGKFDGYIA